MVLEILCVEPISPQYSGVLETCVALRYWFFEVLGSESVNRYTCHYYANITINYTFKNVLKYEVFCQLRSLSSI